MKNTMRILCRASLLAVAASALLAASAVASPLWRFNGSELVGSETVVGAATSSSLTIPNMTTTCEHFLYNMKISNSGGTGKGELVELPLFGCHTNTSVCTVSSITPERLPWAAHLTSVAGKDYLVVEGVRVSIVYGGELCALDGTRIIVKGSAGGLVENSAETATFGPASFEATGTQLTVAGQPVEWNGVFPTEAFESHRLQKLEVG